MLEIYNILNMKNEMTNLKQRNKQYTKGVIAIGLGVFFSFRHGNFLIISGMLFIIGISFLLSGYFKDQKDHDENNPITDELTRKSLIVAGFQTFQFWFIGSMVFKLIFSFLSLYMWDGKNNYELEHRYNEWFFILVLIVFLVLKQVYTKRGLPKKFR